MTHSAIIKITFIFLTVNLCSQLFAQTEEFSIIKGKIIDERTGDVLPFVNISSELKSGETIGTQSGIDGAFEIELPTGKHLLKTTYIGFLDYVKEVEIKADDTLVYEISLSYNDGSCPWESSIPYPELQGFWKPEYYFKANRKINQSKRKDKAGVYFYFLNDSLPGKLSWNDGCYFKSKTPPRDEGAAIYFKHIGNGVIEVEARGLDWVTGIPPKCSILNEELVAFMYNINKTKINTSMSNNGQSLSLSLGDEKFVLRKIHNYTLPDFSTELLGTWKPVKGKLKEKKIRKFVNKAEVIFDVKNLEEKLGSVKYKDADCNEDGVNLAYRYYDEDFISFHYFGWNSKDKICNKKFKLGMLLDELYKYGCYLKFNEAKDVVTLQYDENSLVLKKKK